MEPFKRLGTISYSHSIATMAVTLAVSTQYTNVTVWQTPSQITYASKSRAMQPRYAA